MAASIKYLVQAQCEPALKADDSQIVGTLGRDFQIGAFRRHESGFVVEVESEHSLAYGALKDLADLVDQAVSQAGSRLTSGVISRVERNQISVLLEALGPLGRGINRFFGWSKLVTVMFFQQDLTFDLFLNARLGQLQQARVAHSVN